MTRACAAAFLSLAFLAPVLAPSEAQAQERLPLRVRAALGGGAVVSRDQNALLGLDRPVFDGTARLGWVPIEELVIELGLSGSGWLSSRGPDGVLLDATLGLEAGFSVDDVRLWLGAHFGVGLTGRLVRPVVRIEVGVDIPLTEEIGLGPMLRYLHVAQDDDPGLTDDAQALELGASLVFRPFAPAPAPAPVAEPEPAPAPRPLRAPPPPLEREPVDEGALMVLIDQATGVTPSPRELLVSVLFEFDSTDIVPCTVPSLHALRAHLESHPGIRGLRIEGHADGSGGAEYNRDLSLRRAGAIRDWLVEHGVDTGRLEVAGQGEAAPLEGNDDPEGRMQNRRARFLVVDEGEGADAAAEGSAVSAPPPEDEAPAAPSGTCSLEAEEAL